MLDLIIGKPEDGPASYTRFVLPFAYRLKNFTGDTAPQYAYQLVDEKEANLSWREKYFTRETADVLFHRARWFTLCEKEKTPARVTFVLYSKDIDENHAEREKSISVYMAAPALCLFEWPFAGNDSPRNGSPYSENLKHDLLRIGFLIVTISFPDNQYVQLNDLLRINELFRYWQQPYPGHQNQGYRTLLRDVPRKFGNKETIGGIEKDDPVGLYLDRWASMLEDIPVVDEHDNQWEFELAADGDEYRKPAQERSWQVYADNRAFVWTCALMDGGGDRLRKETAPADRTARVNAWELGHWIKLLNVDNPYSGNNNDLQKSTELERIWAEERTYKRWQEQGTFYGFCYHSGAMLGPDWTEPPLWQHFCQMYFDQALLLLYVRIALFRFSMELNDLSGKAIDKGDTKGYEEWHKAFQNLRWTFALFANLYQFPLLSNQQQGIEMYQIMRKSMDIDELFKEIEKEINSSHEYLSVRQDQEQTQVTTILTVVATVGFILAVPLSFLGV